MVIAVGALGLVIGTAGALAIVRFLSAFLYGIAPTDVVSFVTAAAILRTIAMTDSYLPARRATKVDPLAALRCE